MSITYDRTLPSGKKVAEHAAKVLALIDEAPTLKAIADEAIKFEGTTNKAMLELGYAAKVVEVTIDQSAGSSPGNVNIGDTYTGGTSGAAGVIAALDDAGSIAKMQLVVTSGTFEVDEIVTASGSSTNTGQIDAIEQSPGGGDGKYSGEIQFGAEAGAGPALYDAIAAIADASTGLTALRDDYAKLFQG